MEIGLPLSPETARRLRAGDEVELTGIALTGRDQACARLYQRIQAGEPLPVDLRGEVLYFVGPTPAPPGRLGAVSPVSLPSNLGKASRCRNCAGSSSRDPGPRAGADCTA